MSKNFTGDPRFLAALRDAQARGQTQGAVAGLDFVGARNSWPGFQPQMAEHYGINGVVNGVDFVGAQMGQNQSAQRALFAQMMQNSQVQTPSPGVFRTGDLPVQPRKKVAGLPVTTIQVGATTGSVKLTVLGPIRVERIVLVAPNAFQNGAQVLVSDIKVGPTSQNMGDGPIPIETFAETAFDTSLRGETINVGVPLLISFQLLSPALVPIVIVGSITGESLNNP